MSSSFHQLVNPSARQATAGFCRAVPGRGGSTEVEEEDEEENLGPPTFLKPLLSQISSALFARAKEVVTTAVSPDEKRRLLENPFFIETYKNEHLFSSKVACGAALPDSLCSSTALRGGLKFSLPQKG